jgi:hypothetical protein
MVVIGYDPGIKCDISGALGFLLAGVYGVVYLNRKPPSQDERQSTKF